MRYTPLALTRCGERSAFLCPLLLHLHQEPPITRGLLPPRLHFPRFTGHWPLSSLESILTKGYQNKQPQLSLESRLMKNIGSGGAMVNQVPSGCKVQTF